MCMLVPDIMCGTMHETFTIPGTSAFAVPTLAESALVWGGKKVSQTFTETPPHGWL